jgi:hypothetical protein
MSNVRTLARGLGVLALLAAAASTVACGGGGGSGGGVSAAQLSTDLRSVTESAREAARESNPGEFAADFVRGTNFTELWIEVDTVAGRTPDFGALELLRTRLEERCDKPGGVHFFLDDEIPASQFPAVLGSDDLDAIEDAYRGTYSNLQAGMAAMYVLCVPGGFEEDSSEGRHAGLAYRGASIALFLDGCDQGDDRYKTTAEVEALTLVHEAGHLLGLVNSGVPMVTAHEDLERPGHDANPNSVMHWAIDVERYGSNLGDADFAQFGPECIEDLQAFGGR